MASTRLSVLIVIWRTRDAAPLLDDGEPFGVLMRLMDEHLAFEVHGHRDNGEVFSIAVLGRLSATASAGGFGASAVG